MKSQIITVKNNFGESMYYYDILIITMNYWVETIGCNHIKII